MPCNSANFCFPQRKTKNEKRKTKNEKRKTKNEKRKTKNEKRKTKNERAYVNQVAIHSNAKIALAALQNGNKVTARIAKNVLMPRENCFKRQRETQIKRNDVAMHASVQRVCNCALDRKIKRIKKKNLCGTFLDLPCRQFESQHLCRCCVSSARWQCHFRS